MREFKINANDAGQRVDKFLIKALPEMPKSAMYKAIRKKDIKLNGKRCDIADFLSEGDILRVFIKDDILGTARKAEKKAVHFENAADVADDIIYEDENILLICKKVGCVIHSDAAITENTLVDQVKKYLYNKNEYRPADENSFAPAVCNRLDRNTQGIVIAAKNAAALRAVNEKIRNNTISKRYICLTASCLPEKSDTAVAYHKKDPSSNTVSIRPDPAPGYKQIITKYTVLEKRGSIYVNEVELITGRTHQIRAHLSYLGCPIIGDTKYGSKAVNEKYRFRYQTLCAYKLVFKPDKESGGLLDYLDSKEFKTDNIWFMENI